MADREPLLDPNAVSLRALLLVLAFPAIGGFLFGYDIGSTSMVLSQLKGEFAGVPWGESVADSAFLSGLFTASAVGGALLGVIVIFRVADALGRRRTLIASGMMYAVGGMLEALSSIRTLDRNSGFAVAILGRWVYGVACGFAMHGAPAYLSEMSPPSVRGLMVSMKEAAIVAGILVGQGVGFAFRHDSGGWRYTYGLSIPLAVVMTVGMISMPPSARWLALQGRYAEAEVSLRYFMKTGAREAIAEIRQQCEDYQSRPKLSVLDRRYMWQLTVGVGLVTLQQISGQPSVLYYTNEIFSAANVGAGATIAVGAFKLVATLGAVVTVDRYGRRKLLLAGVGLMLLALIAITGCFIRSSATDEAPDSVKATLITAMFLYIGGYQVGFGPVNWLIISEIFPLEVRGQAVAISVSSNFLWNLVVTLAFEGEIRALGPWPTFAIFAVITLLALFFIHLRVPETKGLTLEQIEGLFQGWPSLRPSSLQHDDVIEAAMADPLLPSRSGTPDSDRSSSSVSV